MNQILLVGVGGFIGAIMRFIAGGWLQKYSAAFPYGTLAVNFTGTLALGFIMYSADYKGLFDADNVRIRLRIIQAPGTKSTGTFCA
jgi:CrcB protein